jgi:hypothetical protein
MTKNKFANSTKWEVPVTDETGKVRPDLRETLQDGALVSVAQAPGDPYTMPSTKCFGLPSYFHAIQVILPADQVHFQNAPTFYQPAPVVNAAELQQLKLAGASSASMPHQRSEQSWSSPAASAPPAPPAWLSSYTTAAPPPASTWSPAATSAPSNAGIPMAVPSIVAQKNTMVYNGHPLDMLTQPALKRQRSEMDVHGPFVMTAADEEKYGAMAKAMVEREHLPSSQASA